MSVNGTPADCVKLALNAIVDKQPDLVLAGINHGSNTGNSVIYSGTMGAVIEGCLQGIPSIGFSVCTHNPSAADFDAACRTHRNHTACHRARTARRRVPQRELPQRRCRERLPTRTRMPRPMDRRICPLHKSGRETVLHPDGKIRKPRTEATDTDLYWNAQATALLSP